MEEKKSFKKFNKIPVSVEDIIRNNKFVGIVKCDSFLVFRNEEGKVINVDNTKIRMYSRYGLHKVQQTTIDGKNVFMIKGGAGKDEKLRPYVIYYVYSNEIIEL